jgi:hypothetical protein
MVTSRTTSTTDRDAGLDGDGVAEAVVDAVAACGVSRGERDLRLR